MITFRPSLSLHLATTLAAASLACAPVDPGTPDAGEATTDAGETTSSYVFTSRFDATKSSVGHAGQAFRHVLIQELENHLDGLTARLDTGALTPTEGSVVAGLDFYFSFPSDGSGNDVPLTIEATPGVKQATFGDFPSRPDLKGKLAGNDPVGQHQDFKTAFKGWSGQASTEGLVRQLFAQVEAAAIARADGDIPKGPDGKAIPNVLVSTDGVHALELLQKFLLGAVAFSQATDDYLDDDVPGNGLLADNTAQDGTNPWTALEHQWDEGFGYFGAAHDADAYTVEELAGAGGREGFKTGEHDTDGDGKIDLLGEFNFANAAYAARRDHASSAGARTHFFAEAFNAFVAGRTLISSAGGALSAEQLTTLKGHRDAAVRAWEQAIGASIVHYVNEVLVHMGDFGTEAYDFEDHAAHWSEAKGLALALQFNPRSPLSDAAFDTLHEQLGQRPVLPGATTEAIDAAKTALRAARATLASTYGFDPSNVGDADGHNGW